MLSAVGIHGRMGSGKDALAQVLIDEFGFQRFAFGDLVKDEAVAAIKNWPKEDKRIYPFDVEQILERCYQRGDFEAPLRKPTNADMRVVLQWWGTGYRRRQNPDYWVEAPRVGKLPKKVVITDVRFPNEMAMIKAFGGEVWLIERPVDEVVNSAPGDAGHISEQLLTLVGREAFDRVFDNSGTLEELWQAVRDVIKPPKKPKTPAPPAAAPVQPELVTAAAAAISAPGTEADPADSMLKIQAAPPAAAIPETPACPPATA